MTICPVCKSGAESIPLAPGKDASGFSCEGCGEFEVTGSVLRVLPHRLQTESGAEAKLRHWLRKAQGATARPKLDSHLLDEIIAKATIPTAMEQADSFLLAVGRRSQYPGQLVKVPVLLGTAIMGAPTPEAYRYIRDHLVEEGFIRDESSRIAGGPHAFYGLLTVRGWDRFREMERNAADSRVVFMAMKYGDSLLDRVVDECFRPAVETTGLWLRRLDDQPKAGLIDNRLRVEIRDSVMLIADLSHDNSGAYWEAGYAEGLGRPVLYTCHEHSFHKIGEFAKSPGSHFDTNHCTTVLWHPDALSRAAEELTAAIRFTLPTITNRPGR